MKRIIVLLFVLLSGLYATKIDELLVKSGNTIDRFMAIPEESIPPQLFRKCSAIAIVPGMIRGGFILGARYGHGVVFFKNGNDWSNPIFIKMYGGSIGWQIGLESIDIVLFFMKKDIFSDIVNGKITLGVDLSVAVGPVGRSALAGTDIKLESQVYSYSRSKGAFVGVALAGSSIEPDSDYNEEFYQTTYIKLQDIFQRKFDNQYLQILKSKLREYSNW